jgi:hypothetical protein
MYLKQGTVIKMKQPDTLQGVEGKIVGVSGISQPSIGASYIIKSYDSRQVYTKEYRYEYFVAFECMFDVIEVPVWRDTRTEYVNVDKSE